MPNDECHDTKESACETKMKEHKGLFIDIGERMKAYERKSVVTIDPRQPYIIRLDGHNFSNFTQPFR